MISISDKRRRWWIWKAFSSLFFFQLFKNSKWYNLCQLLYLQKILFSISFFLSIFRLFHDEEVRNLSNIFLYVGKVSFEGRAKRKNFAFTIDHNLEYKFRSDCRSKYIAIFFPFSLWKCFMNSSGNGNIVNIVNYHLAKRFYPCWRFLKFYI